MPSFGKGVAMASFYPLSIIRIQNFMANEFTDRLITVYLNFSMTRF